jgi:hypothetical protein
VPGKALNFSAYCFVPSAYCDLELVVVVVIVVEILINNIEFDGIEADDLQTSSALFTCDLITFVRVRIDMHIGIAFGTCSGGHLTLPPANKRYSLELGQSNCDRQILQPSFFNPSAFPLTNESQMNVIRNLFVAGLALR